MVLPFFFPSNLVSILRELGDIRAQCVLNSVLSRINFQSEPITVKSDFLSTVGACQGDNSNYYP